MTTPRTFHEPVVLLLNPVHFKSEALRAALDRPIATTSAQEAVPLSTPSSTSSVK